MTFREYGVYRGVWTDLVVGIRCVSMYRFSFVFLAIVAPLACVAEAQSVAQQWNNALLDAIRIDFPAPTVHSRNLYHLSSGLYDSWAAFDPIASGHFYDEKHAWPTGSTVQAAQEEAMSYAAYRILSERYIHAVDPDASQARFDATMQTLGYDPAIETTEGNSPAAIGNRIAQQILTTSLNDGSNEAGGYVDNTGYLPINDPMVVDYPAVVTPDASPLSDPNRWQPLFLESAMTQNELRGENLQVFVGPHWGNVTTFAMGHDRAPGEYSWAAIDPGAPPMLGGEGDAVYRDETVALIRYSAGLDPNQGAGAEYINISPAVTGNRPLGTHTDVGFATNPATGEPYADNMVKRGDYGRVLAEFWADGPKSETPPGHWNVIANEVAADSRLQKRIGGEGEIVSDLEWDVKLYLALNGAVHDAAIAAWGTKREYDYVRPITKIRYQGGLGQSTDSSAPNYHVDGLPIEPGLIEQVTAESIAPGGRHRNVYDNANQNADGEFQLHYSEEDLIGKIAVMSWNHEPEDRDTQVSGTDWILAENWVPYQDDNFVTPAFAAYVSGHSTFSRAAAQVMTEITGSEFFPGGLGELTFTPEYLDFEQGPSEAVTLQWATYFDAADEAGISRLYGGIHVPADDFAGRIMGDQIGREAAEYAKEHFVDDDLTWRNRVHDRDINFDGLVSAEDAFSLRDELNSRDFSDQMTSLLSDFDKIPPAFYDCDGDGYATPFDLLMIINQLTEQASQTNSSLSGNAMSIPEPSYSFATVLALLILCGVRRRSE